MTPRRLILLSAAAVISVACSSGAPVDIGDPTPGATLSDSAGSWDGYAEFYTFPPSGSDRVRMVLRADGSGTIEFGDGPQLPEATDPDVAYPVRWNEPGFALLGAIRDGFKYPIYDVSLDGSRFRLALNQYDLYKTWCGLQTAYLLQGDEYTCIELPSTDQAIYKTPTDGSSTCELAWQDGSALSVDCGKFAQCGHVCLCNASGCWSRGLAEFGGHYVVLFDGILDGDSKRLTGTLRMQDDSRITIRLRRN